MVEVIIIYNIGFIVVLVTIMLCRLLAESAICFLWPEEFENVANPDFENPKHLQNPGHLLLTAPIIFLVLTS